MLLKSEQILLVLWPCVENIEIDFRTGKLCIFWIWKKYSICFVNVEFQSWILVNSWFKVAVTVVRLLCFMAIFVSSAKARLKRLVELKRSSMNIMKRRQLRLEPWMRPKLTISNRSEKQPFTSHDCILPVRYDLNHLNISPTF